MKLVLKRGQASKMLGGISFELSAKVELTSEENQLVKKYKAEREILLQKEIPIPFSKKSFALNITDPNCLC